MKTCRNLDTARTQLRLHVMLAIHAAIETDSLVPIKEFTAPTIAPADLGGSTPARSRGNTQGSELVGRLGAAMINHTLTPRPHLAAQLQRGARALGELTPPAGRWRERTTDHYRVTLASLGLRLPEHLLTLPAQQVDLDCRTGALKQALRVVEFEPRPATRARGRLARQHISTPAHVWEAWTLLADAVLDSAQVQLAPRDCAESAPDMPPVAPPA